MLGGLALDPLSDPSIARAVDELPLDLPSWSRSQGMPVATLPYGVPSEFETSGRRGAPFMPTETASASRTPLQDLHGMITPGGLVFERHHAGVPRIDPERHRLLVHGLVKRPLIFTMNDLTRFPSISRIGFLECAGNTQGWQPGSLDLTVQDTHGLLSCCEWTGVLLSTILGEVGVEPASRWLLAEGADAAMMSRSLPLAAVMDDAVLVYSQNGERLRPEQGYPLRLFLPGLEVSVSIKWLRRIKVGQHPFETREETAKYTSLMPDGRAQQFTLLMEVKSVITFPSGGHLLPQPGFYEISGLAWSGSGRVRAVDVSTDGGASWRSARLQEPILAKCLTQFRVPWHWDGSPALLRSRAIDEAGNVQPSHEAIIAGRGSNAFYHYNGIHSWKVEAGGSVLNAS